MNTKSKKLCALAAVALMVMTSLAIVILGEEDSNAISNDVTNVNGYVRITDNDSTTEIPAGCGDALKVTSRSGNVVTLSMNGLSISSTGHLFTEASKFCEFIIECDAIINVTGVNSIVMSEDSARARNSLYGLCCTGNLTIQGPGELSVIVNNDDGLNADDEYGIYVENDLNVKDKVTVNSTSANIRSTYDSSIGVCANNITVSGGATLSAAGGKDIMDMVYSIGIFCKNKLSVTYSTLIATAQQSTHQYSTSKAIRLNDVSTFEITCSKTYFTGYHGVFMGGSTDRPICTDCIDVLVSETFEDANPTTHISPGTQMGNVKTYKTTAEFPEPAPVGNNPNPGILLLILGVTLMIMLLATRYRDKEEKE